MKQLLSLSLFFLMSSSLLAQLNIPDRVSPFRPIVAGCSCIVPPNGAIDIMWRYDSTVFALPVNGDKELHIWTIPGNHWIELTALIKTYRDLKVFVPDPNFPTDPTKAKLETIKVLEKFDIQRYQKDFVAEGIPPPGPGPDPPPPGPDPPPPGPGPGGFAGQVQGWLKGLAPGMYSKEKALKVGSNYASVSAQAVATSGWNLEAFVAATKIANQKVFTTPAETAEWGTKVFNPLAVKQQMLFTERNLNTSDVQGIAQLWRDTADAFKNGAY